MKKIRNTENGKEGFVIDDSFGCCSFEESLVVYDETNTGLRTNRNLLKEIPFIVPIPDPMKCGVSKGKNCCIFLIVKALDGFCCERFTSLRDTLIFTPMNAKKNPIEPYPECMNQE